MNDKPDDEAKLFYGKNDKIEELSNIKDFTFKSVNGFNEVYIEKFVSNTSLEDVFGTKEDPSDNNVYIIENFRDLKYCFEGTVVESYEADKDLEKIYLSFDSVSMKCKSA